MPVKRQNAGPSTSQKRTRFASPPPSSSKRAESSEPPDDLLEEDLPEGAQRARSKAKRQLRDTEGYESDSSNDEESVVPSRRPGGKDDEGDGDVDMFADPGDGKDDKGKGKGKEQEKKEFMSLDEIEGQEFDRRRGGSGTGSEDGDSETEEGRARKRKEGLDGDMGIDITPFNMTNEMEEGRFTADGESYVVNDLDPNDKHDMWLDDVDEDTIDKAKRAHKERERIEREREEKEQDALETGKDREERLMRQAVGLMERGETVLEALQRLGAEDKRKKAESGAGKKKTWAERQRERKAGGHEDGG